MELLITFMQNPFVVAMIAAAVLVFSALPLLRRQNRSGSQARDEQIIREKAIRKLKAANSFQMLDITEKDAHTVLDVVIEDKVVLEGTYAQASQYIQDAAHKRTGTLLNEDQISAVLAAYQQAKAN